VLVLLSVSDQKMLRENDFYDSCMYCFWLKIEKIRKKSLLKFWLSSYKILIAIYILKGRLVNGVAPCQSESGYSALGTSKVQTITLIKLSSLCTTVD